MRTLTLCLYLSLCLVRYAPSQRWHIDTILHVLTTVNTQLPPLHLPLHQGIDRPPNMHAPIRMNKPCVSLKLVKWHMAILYKIPHLIYGLLLSALKYN